MGANAWLRIKTGISALVLPRKVHLRLAEKLPQKGGGPAGVPNKRAIWINLDYGFAPCCMVLHPTFAGFEEK